MFRFGILVAVCGSLLGCAGMGKAINERAKEIIDSSKNSGRDTRAQPDHAAEKTLRTRSEVVWVKAGMQADGKIFVCYVTKTPRKNIWGQAAERSRLCARWSV